MTKGILEGIRVLDWTLYQVGPYGAAMLADLGADVIHIEERGKGDALRGITHTAHSLPTHFPQAPERHIHFEEHNRNKKSLAVDLKKAQGREVIYRLVERADVFVTNFRAQAAKRLGLDYETLRLHNPRLIYAWASGLGSRGPEKDAPSIDVVANARSGIMMACGEGAEDPPVRIAPGLGDRIASIFLAYGVLGALLARERYGVGQEVKISQLGSLINLYGFTIQPCLALERDYPRPRRTQMGNPLYNQYRCGDGRWLTLGLTQGDRYWPVFCQALGRPDLEKDPRFEELQQRAKHSAELVGILDQVFASRPLSEWEKVLSQADLPYGRVNSVIDLLNDPQVLANEYIKTWDHPVMGPIRFLGFPVEFSQTPATLRDPAPEVGQHNEELLLEAGYGWEEINQLREKEVI